MTKKTRDSEKQNEVLTLDSEIVANMQVTRKLHKSVKVCKKGDFLTWETKDESGGDLGQFGVQTAQYMQKGWEDTDASFPLRSTFATSPRPLFDR